MRKLKHSTSDDWLHGVGPAYYARSIPTSERRSRTGTACKDDTPKLSETFDGGSGLSMESDALHAANHRCYAPKKEKAVVSTPG